MIKPDTTFKFYISRPYITIYLPHAKMVANVPVTLAREFFQRSMDGPEATNWTRMGLLRFEPPDDDGWWHYRFSGEHMYGAWRSFNDGERSFFACSGSLMLLEHHTNTPMIKDIWVKPIAEPTFWENCCAAWGTLFKFIRYWRSK